jgi:cytochrome c-type biogenesis protein
MAADVTILAALFAGLVSFLSPCVLPLVPPYLVYLAGTSLERLAEAEPPPLVKRDTVIAAVLFVAGFSTVFVALGASASVIGALMRFYSNELAIIAGLAIIIMGLHFLGLTPIGFLHRQARIHVAKPVGLWGAYVMGLAFALGWTPCIGPILAAILAIAPRARGCLPFTHSGWACRSSSPRLRSSRLPPSSPAFAPISPMSSG